MGAIDKFFRGLDDNERRCFLRVAALRELVGQADVLRALVDQLEVPGKASTLKALSHDEMFEAVAEQIEKFTASKTSIWRNARGGEVLAASLFFGAIAPGGSPHWKKARKAVMAAFHPADRESALLKPVAGWLRARSMDVYDEVPMGTKRADVVGHREGKFLGIFSELDVYAVELKNELDQFKRGLDQLSTFKDYSTATYLACTPFMAAAYLDKHAQAKEVLHWDDEVLHRRVMDVGCGLLLVEGEVVTEYIPPKKQKIADAKLVELRRALAKRPKLGAG